MRNRKKYPRHDDETHEWFFNGKWYDHYPAKESQEFNDRYDEWQETKFDEKRDEGEI